MLSGWLIFGIVALFLIAFAFKSQDFVFFFAFIKKYFIVLGIVSLVLLFAFSAAKVYKTNSEIDLTSPSGVIKLGGVYFSWLKGIFGNIARATGSVVNQDWSVNLDDRSDESENLPEQDSVPIELNESSDGVETNQSELEGEEIEQ
jgi:hypothetical protein